MKQRGVFIIDNLNDEINIDDLSSIPDDFKYQDKDILLKTGDVAKMLGETTAMIRVYCKNFEQYLDMKHTPGEHRTFNHEHILKLKNIIYLCKEKHLTTAQAQNFLRNNQRDCFLSEESYEVKFNKLVDLISSKILESFNDTLNNNYLNTIAFLSDIRDDLARKLLNENLQLEKKIETLNIELQNELKKNNELLEFIKTEIEKSSKQSNKKHIFHKLFK